MDKQIRQADIEYVGLITDYYKHLTTLSTGSIVIVATFLDKFAEQPNAKQLAVYAIIGFVVCILAMLFAMLLYVAEHSKEGGPIDAFIYHRKPWRMFAETSVVTLALLGFIGAIICLALFAAQNIM